MSTPTWSNEASRRKRMTRRAWYYRSWMWKYRAIAGKQQARIDFLRRSAIALRRSIEVERMVDAETKTANILFWCGFLCGIVGWVVGKWV